MLLILQLLFCLQ